MTSSPERNYDLVVFGATSFVGRLLCSHLVERHGVDGDLRWAIAGRSAGKLDAVAGDTGADVPRIVADASDRFAMAELAQSTSTIVSTVGPYALYGSEVVAAAVAAGTDYCDLTGETQWMASMIGAHEAEAIETGSRIVHTCGFDSIPSDLGVWFLQNEARQRNGSYCNRVAMRVKALKGGASGGTVASMVNIVEEAAKDSELRRLLADPYSLTPVEGRSTTRQRDISRPTRDEISGQWIAPFVMAAINTRVVHRTHALLGHPWGDDFSYDEAMLMGEGVLGAAKATGLSGGLAGFMALTALSPTRALLSRYVLPKPGEGPTPAAQAAGFFDLRFFGSTPEGQTVRTQVTGDMDPGYGSTAKMLGETAVALTQLDRADCAGGFWTPATALGQRLIDVLEEHAGLTFEVID